MKSLPTENTTECPARPEPPYVTAFREWMQDFKPDVFVTINLPKEPDGGWQDTWVPRSPLFYLSHWTRSAEAKVLGPRTLKIAKYDRRIVWIFRREVSPAGLVHYHGIVRFPEDREWKHERAGHTQDLATRCRYLLRALITASKRTPEPYATNRVTARFGADLDVRPCDAAYHAPYLLKGLWKWVPPSATDESTWDSGLIILPHLPKKGLKKWHQNAHYGTGSLAFA